MDPVLYDFWVDSLSGRTYADNPASPDSLRRPVNVDVQLLRKQFSDSELAAEYWRAERDVLEVLEHTALEGWFNGRGDTYLSDDAALAWRDTMHRFADLRPWAGEEDEGDREAR